MQLEIKGISKYFGNRQILQDINIHLEQGELVCILGTSGVGKTTLFHIIAGLYYPEQGNILLNRQDITGMPGQVSYMLQKDMMLPYKTVLDNVALPLMIRGEGTPWKRKKRAREKAASFFKEFGIDGYEKKYPAQMSGGMRQRAALLRTYLFSHKVALLDEPFSALDTITKNSMHNWYLDVMEKIKLSTLFITHDIDEAVLLSDRIYILMGTPGQIIKEISIDVPRPRSQEFLLSEKFIKYKKEILEKISPEALHQNLI